MAQKHYDEQFLYSKTYLIQFLTEKLRCSLKELNILEVGCAEGGFIAACNDENINVDGLELESSRVETALKMNPAINVKTGDITKKSIFNYYEENKYDLIIIRDVIEHIEEKNKAFANMKKLLKEGGHIFITFPPLYSPFAGHQQNGHTLIAKTPYIHLLPVRLFKFFAKTLNENPSVIDDIIFNRANGLSIKSFFLLCAKHDLNLLDFNLFLFRPIFQIRFGLSPRKFPNMPIIREFFSLGCETILKKTKNAETNY